MQTSNYTYLEFVPFKNVLNWSVVYLLEQQIQYTHRYPLVKIGNLLNRYKRPTNIQDTTDYKRITVKVRNGGITLRDIEHGKNIGTKKQFLVRDGLFLLSKIDARNGAMGIIPQDLDGAVVTQDFLAYDFDKEQVNPDYFIGVCATQEFMNYCQSCSSGTTNRQRIDEKQFLNIKIPLPTLAEQESIMAVYNAKVAQAAELEALAAKYEAAIENYLLDTLGINFERQTTTSTSDYKFLKFIGLKGLEEWGYDLIHNKQKQQIYKYPTYLIKELCKIGSGGTPSRTRTSYFNGDIPWIKTGELNNNIIYSTEEHISEDGLKNSSAKWYDENSLVIAMYGATIGKTAKLGIKATTNQACAVLHDIKSTISIDYLWYYLQSKTEYYKQLAYGGAQPNINAGIVANTLVPIPPMSLQNEIVEHINAQKKQIKNCKSQAAQLCAQALAEFEKEIFE